MLKMDGFIYPFISSNKHVQNTSHGPCSMLLAGGMDNICIPPDHRGSAILAVYSDAFPSFPKNTSVSPRN